MAKWADYCISAVKYDSDHSRIVECHVHEDKGDKIGTLFIETRMEIVAKLKRTITYCTIRENKDGNWKKGDNVIQYLLDGEYFIRTDGNQTKKDNLGELPEY
ncbi:MAG: DUF3892 domain-containing protein [Anaerolineaceae bacterium]|nr:DUF3892 domain-containing protein [Anaerolineaceae bacterium]